LQFWLYLISWHVGLFSVMLLGQVKRERERERERERDTVDSAELTNCSTILPLAGRCAGQEAGLLVTSRLASGTAAFT
jgi:hypothetical protein